MTRPRFGTAAWPRRAKWLSAAGGAEAIAAIGITNQRETVVAWDRATGEPIGTALVWQDRRTAKPLPGAGRRPGRNMIQQRTGLLLDPYFSATKMEWMLANRPDVRAAGRQARVRDDRLLAAVEADRRHDPRHRRQQCQPDHADGAGRQRLGRRALRAYSTSRPRACRQLSIAHGPIGETDPSLFGLAIPICGMAGDQQAATIGQGCLEPGPYQGDVRNGRLRPDQ